jgi:hypothetical protein
VDYAQLGASHAERYRGTFARLVDQADSGVLPAEQTHHSRYTDFVDDALGTVTALYERFGRALTPEARDAMEQVLAKRGAGEGSTHSYQFEDLGLDRAEERAHYARYQSRFDVPDES